MKTQSDARQGQNQAAKVFLYFAPLTLLVSLSSPASYLVDIATSYMLKDQLHATVDQVANFRLRTAVPTYLAVLFGLSRDLWNPLGRRDRGFFLIFAPLTALLYVWLAFSHLSYTGLFVGVFLRIEGAALGDHAVPGAVGFEVVRFRLRDRTRLLERTEVGDHAPGVIVGVHLDHSIRHARDAMRAAGARQDAELERLSGCPPEHLDFHLWYLKAKGWIATGEDGLLAITIDGVDRASLIYQEDARRLLTDQS